MTDFHIDDIVKKFNLVDYLMITLGSFVMALGVGVFLVDAQVVPGGVSGLSMAVYYMSGNTLPIGLLMWGFNIPLFIWGVKVLGSRFGWRTFYGFTANSFFIDLVRGDIPGFSNFALQKTQTVIELLEKDFFFSILLGAVLLGFGLGIIFKHKGTTAGSDIIAAIFQKKYGMKPGQAIMIIDFVVIVFAGIVIQYKGLSIQYTAASLTLYAFFLLFVSARLIDIILDGFDYARSATIISEKNDEIGKAIVKRLSRGATAVKGRGLYTNTEREVVMTVVSRKEVGILTEIVETIDPKAFVIISNVHEVLGKGFRRRT
jgi:uncharacterized membrane-anchored protein YitT (DUF2179 family)